MPQALRGWYGQLVWSLCIKQAQYSTRHLVILAFYNVVDPGHSLFLGMWSAMFTRNWSWWHFVVWLSLVTICYDQEARLLPSIINYDYNEKTAPIDDVLAHNLKCFCVLISFWRIHSHTYLFYTFVSQMVSSLQVFWSQFFAHFLLFPYVLHALPIISFTLSTWHSLCRREQVKLCVRQFFTVPCYFVSVPNILLTILFSGPPFHTVSLEWQE